MIIVHLIAVVVFGYFVYQNIQLKKQISQSQPTPIASITPIVLPTDPVTNWKTFIKSDWSFKYPTNLIAKEPEENFIDLVDSEDTPATNARISIDARLIAPYLDDYDTAFDRRATDLNIIDPQITPLTNGVIISGKLGPGMGGATGYERFNQIQKWGNSSAIYRR